MSTHSKPASPSDWRKRENDQVAKRAKLRGAIEATAEELVTRAGLPRVILNRAVKRVMLEFFEALNDHLDPEEAFKGLLLVLESSVVGAINLELEKVRSCYNDLAGGTLSERKLDRLVGRLVEQPAPSVDYSRHFVELARALERASPRDREIWTYRFQYKLSYEEIARYVGTSAVCILGKLDFFEKVAGKTQLKGGGNGTVEAGTLDGVRVRAVPSGDARRGAGDDPAGSAAA